MSTVYEIITERILASLEKGTVPWQCPWKRRNGGGMPINHTTGRPYRGVNVWTLACAGFPVPRFLTFNQARTMGGCVRKGEHGFPVIFWKKLPPKSKPADGEAERSGFMLRYFTVFNVDQVDGIGSFAAPEPVAADVVPTMDECERIVAGYKLAPTIEHRGERAFYRMSDDAVTMPPRHLFSGSEEYYSTLFHELGHSTGHATRLDRFKKSEHGSAHAYSAEELVAEFTASYLCGIAGITRTMDNSAAYIASWSQRLRNNPRWAITAAAQAQKAADLILGASWKEEAEKESETAVA